MSRSIPPLPHTSSHAQGRILWLRGTKYKTKLAPFTPRRYIGGVETQLHSFFNSVVEKGSGQLHTPGRFHSGEKEPGTNSIKGCVVSTATPDVLEKRKISCPSRYPNVRSSSV
jgi:hypothetical protein